MNVSIIPGTLNYTMWPKRYDPISFNQQIINQYGIEGFILYLIFIFIIGTVGSYIIMKEMEKAAKREEEEEDED